MIETASAEKLEKIFSQFKGLRDELIPIMEAVQDEFGYLPAEVMSSIARFLKIPESHVYGVATFYALFKLTPSGRKTIRVCRGTACHVKGGARIINEIQHLLRIKPGQTTEDMEYTLETVACIGACALAPNITIGKEIFGQLTTKKVAEVLGDRSKSGEKRE